MGDRCYIHMRVRTSDLPKFLSIINDEPDHTEVEAGYTTIEIHEANYGLYQDRCEAAEAGCVFSGYHTSGVEYDASLFAAADGKMVEVSATGVNLDVAVVVTEDEDGKVQVSQDDLDNAQRYFDMDKRVDALLLSADQPKGEGNV